MVLEGRWVLCYVGTVQLEVAFLSIIVVWLLFFVSSLFLFLFLVCSLFSSLLFSSFWFSTSVLVNKNRLYQSETCQAIFTLL